MYKNFIKTAFVVVCIVAAGLGGMKAYDVANQSKGNDLLAENVEALSSGEVGFWCKSGSGACDTGGSELKGGKDNIRYPGWWPY